MINEESGFYSPEEDFIPELDNPSEYTPQEPTDSPVAKFMHDYENTFQSGDPFRIVQRASRTSEQIITTTKPYAESGLYGLSAESSKLFAHLGKQIVQSGQDQNIASPLRFSGDSSTRMSGFVSRPLASDYKSLFEKPGEFKASFFQFQQEEIVTELLKRSDPTTILTQRATFTSTVPDDTTAQILLGNELTYAAGSALRSSRSSVLGIQSYASFHPKVGYVGDPQRGFTAFLGTQNITPALAGNNSLETLMVFSSPGQRAILLTLVELLNNPSDKKFIS
jgi:hypothetical protein